MEKQISLEKRRKQIDLADAMLIKCLAKRQEIVKEIAEIKKKENLPIFCPERELQLLEEKQKLACLLDLNPNFIVEIFKVILENSKNIQLLEVNANERKN